MSGPDHGEVPPIERCDLADIEPFGESDHRGVGRTESEILIALDEFSHSRVVLRREVGDLVVAVRDGAMKRSLGSTPQLGVQKIADLRNNRLRDEEPPSSQTEASPQLHADMVIRVIDDRSSHQGAGVQMITVSVPAEPLGEDLVYPF